MSFYIKVISFVILSLCCICIHAKSIHPITQAMLDGYEKILIDNPTDYFTLYQRAQQYYQLNIYDKALSDVSKSIEFTPSKDKDLLSKLYSLKADIYIETDDYNNAFNSIIKALEYSPNSYGLLYAKGNICLHLNDLENAKKAFRNMQQINSRSQEAFFGLARIAILQEDITLARTLMNEGEKCSPSNYITYCRLGDLYLLMEEYDKASTSYLSAFGLTTDSERPINSLIKLSKVNYNSVKDAIDYAISKSPNIISLFLLEANIAYYNNRFNDAYECYRHLLDSKQEENIFILDKMAKISLALNKIEEAIEYSNRAIALKPSTDNLILKAKIERAANNPKNALIAAKDAIETSDRNSSEALTEAALALTLLNETDEAIKLLNEAIMINAEEMYPIIIRAYVYDSILGDLKSSVADYQRVSELEADTFPQLLYKAFALTMSGHKQEGDNIISKAIENHDSNPEINYYIAVYYAQTGELEKAAKFRNNAINLGFENEYLLFIDSTANLNLTPISHL